MSTAIVSGIFLMGLIISFAVVGKKSNKKDSDFNIYS